MTESVKTPDPAARLGAFLDRFAPAIAKSARGVLKAMRRRCPGATLLVYDNYNALAIGFATGERVKDVCVVAEYTKRRNPYVRALPIDPLTPALSLTFVGAREKWEEIL